MPKYYWNVIASVANRSVNKGKGVNWSDGEQIVFGPAKAFCDYFLITAAAQKHFDKIFELVENTSAM